MKSAHSRIFEQLLAERRHYLVEALIGTPDHGCAGMIRGLDEALQLSREADVKLSGDVSDAAA